VLPQTRTLYIQEKVHPKVLIDHLAWETREMEKAGRLQLMEYIGSFPEWREAIG